MLFNIPFVSQSLIQSHLFSVWLSLLFLEFINILALPFYLTMLLSYARIPILTAFFIIGGNFAIHTPTWLGLILLTLPLLGLFLEFRQPIIKEIMHLGEQHPNKFTLYQLNVCYSNEEMETVTRQILELEPDIAILCETNAKWIQYIERAFANTDYHLIKADEGTRKKNTGRITLTRFSVIEDPIFIEQTNAFDVAIKVAINEQEIILLNIHPEACIGYNKYNQQKSDWNNLFRTITELKSDHMIVCGDFNVTPWHYYYRKLIQTLPHCFDDLMNVMCFTFPSWLGPFMFLNLDHCVVSDRLFLSNQYRCNGVHSDHYPLLTTIRF